MEKSSFGELFSRACLRAKDLKLSGFLLLETLVAFVAALPFMAVLGGGVLLWIDRWSRREPTAELPAFLWQLALLLAALLATFLIYAWVLQMLQVGLLRETLYPAADIRRGFRSGFSRWKTVLYPLPWLLAVGMIPCWQTVMERLLPPLGMAAAGAGSLLQIVAGIYTTFLFCGVAAGSPRQKFAGLYRNAFTAFKNGWGRWLVIYLCVLGLILSTVASALPPAFGVFVGIRENRPLALWVG
ncbi:MAG: hypothetical protein IJJ28_01485, partial [Lentisphaeria bacterium]|nr:hypothetical protein [Lentisphaeria bacterium]